MPGRWEEIKGDLLEAVYMVSQPSLSQQDKDEIVGFMNERGHDMGWNAIR